MYRKTLDFPDLPCNAIKLDYNLMEITCANNSIEKLKEKLELLEPYKRIQSILCFRTSSQIDSGK